MTTMTKTGGCGCGGKTTGGCGCKTPATAAGTDIASACSPFDEAAFVRPQFFAGQLLTEDDLTALETYVVGKNRLHNAKLFGDGVVCGLDVTCGPCGGTTVRVAPGYALDCCGNDLVLTCDREIDLKPLIIALREQNHGKGDCGSPCDPPTTSTVTGTTGGAAITPAVTSSSPVIEYCLFLRYSETSSDPIAGYPTPDDCAVACQPTRLREGVSFELRCPVPPTRDDLMTHLEACLGRLSSPDRVTADGRTLEVSANQARRAAQVMDPSVTAITAAESQRWTDAQPRLAAIANTQSDPTGADLLEWTELLIDVAGIFLRQPTGPKAGATSGDTATAAAALQRIAAVLGDPKQLAKISSLLDRTTASEAAAMYTSLTVPSDVAARRVAAVALTGLPYDKTLFLRGALYTRPLRSAYIAAAQDLRGKLLQALSCDGGETADCTLFDDLRNLSLPSTAANDKDIESGDVTDFAGYGHKLGGIVKRFFADCMCRAFAPPCRSCDDPAVLLACIKVRDCQVLEVCNLARTFVLSPAAVRYWLPPISWMGELLARMCCGSTCSDVTKGGTDLQSQFVGELLRNPSADAIALALPAFYRSGAYLPALVSATRSFSDLAVRQLLPGTRRPAFDTPAQVVRDPHSEVDALRAQVAALHARMDRLDPKTKAGKP